MWFVPALVAAAAAVPLALLLRRLLAETGLLRREVQRFSELRPALLELRSEADALRDGISSRVEQRRRG
ncbi:MAG TPA: hypothetical protein VFV35_07715 [Acidimicrobiales bacterium]|nr:hypothetical protein [Acidimicrobiales bacterium]